MRGPRLRPAVRGLLLVLLLALVAGCTLPGPAPATLPTTTPATTANTTTATTPAPPGPPALLFDGGRALDVVRLQVGTPEAPVYRIPGTPDNTRTATRLAAKLDEAGLDVSWHHFNATYGCEETPMHNVVAERAGGERVVVLGAHYDTRPIADKDPDPAKRDEPVLGANDAGSGVAVLVELARVLPETNATIRFVLFDGEDGGDYKGRDCTAWILGSRAYVASLSEAERRRIDAMVLVDMVGDPDLVLPYEGNSDAQLRTEVYAVAETLGHGNVFQRRHGYSIEDDHVPFRDAGIPALDLIHIAPAPRLPVFPDWHHTTFDDMEHVSARSLEVVGETLEAWLMTK